MEILFLCTGNTCRSPMAAGLCEKLLRERGIVGSASSAGLAAQEGEPACENAVLAMREVGVDLSAHRARQFEPEMGTFADQIVVMTPVHRQILSARYPELGEKIVVISQTGVPDPYGGDLALYRRTRDLLLELLPALLPDQP